MRSLWRAWKAGPGWFRRLSHAVESGFSEQMKWAVREEPCGRHQESGRRRLVAGLRVPEALMFVTVPFPVSGLLAIVVGTRGLGSG